jgi:hypothetical protein
LLQVVDTLPESTWQAFSLDPSRLQNGHIGMPNVTPDFAAGTAFGHSGD